MKNMPKLLQAANQGTQGTKLTEPRLFKLVFSDKLDNGYELKDMTREYIQCFHRFLSDTVYKGLTITEVDKLYLRKAGLSKAPVIVSNGHELVHYGKDRTPFRIFGYYNLDGYFVICRIDGKHATNHE